MTEICYTLVYLLLLSRARFEWHEWRAYVILYLIGFLCQAGLRYYWGLFLSYTTFCS
jgi:hypothetical protein